MANLITLSRLLLLGLVVAMIYLPNGYLQLVNVVLLIAVFATDGIDGYVARKRNETSRFGAMFDIASDRIVELTLWIVFVDLNLVPMWVLLIFIARGVIVDAIRSEQAAEHRRSPFAMMSTAIGKWLVAGKSMRIGYSVLKAVTFCWLMLIHGLPAAAPAFWTDWSAVFTSAAFVLVLGSVVVCLARGIPVVAEFVYAERHKILGSLLRVPDR